MCYTSSFHFCNTRLWRGQDYDVTLEYRHGHLQEQTTPMLLLELRHIEIAYVNVACLRM